MEKSRAFFTNPTIRKILVIAIIVITFGVFAYYLATHQDVIKTLLNLPAYLLVILTIGYIGAIAANAFVLHASLALLRKHAPFVDNLALTSYSSIINFFGPLQSGPGARAVYLKAKYGVRFRGFLGTTVAFYAFFAILNCLILGVAALIRFQSWTTLGILIVIATTGSGTLYILYRKNQKVHRLTHLLKFHDHNTWLIGLGAVFLIVATAFSYFFELHYVEPGVQLWQALVYSAAANMALFVSLTPGAIGFRETFLVFSSKLHGIDTANVLAASIIDRAFYILFLLVLFLVLLAFSKKLGLRFFKKPTPEK